MKNNHSVDTMSVEVLESEAQVLGITLEQIRNWTPPAKKKATKKKVSKKAGKEVGK
ncbi:hypothetical protein N9B05_05490 [Mariniblastus sp.]|nr:hypothetical protein [Mariniblastus sp.]